MAKTKILTRLRIDEVSSVDRGAGEGVKILLMKRDEEPYWKREFTAEQRHEDAKSGAAESDGSYPIHDSKDLHNAMQAVGRSKNPEKTRAHIRSRARALGLTSQLSDAFKRDQMPTNSKVGSFFSKLFGGSADGTVVIDKAVDGLAESVVSILGDESVIDKAAELTKTFDQFGIYLKENISIPMKKGEADMDLKSLAKAFGLPETATEADVTAAIAKSQTLVGEAATMIQKLNKENLMLKANFTAEEEAYLRKASMYDEEEDDTDPKLSAEEKKRRNAKKAFREASHERRAEIMKSSEPALPAHIQKVLDDNEAMRKRLEALEGGTTLVTMAKLAKDSDLPETEAETLQKAYTGDRSAVDKLLGFVKQGFAAARAGGVFKEFGTIHGGDIDDSALAQLNKLAADLRKQDAKLTPDQAFSKVYTDPANTELVRKERLENRPSAA